MSMRRFWGGFALGVEKYKRGRMERTRVGKEGKRRWIGGEDGNPIA